MDTLRATVPQDDSSRRRSGRSERKVYGQRKSLGGHDEPKSFNLVVCGATNYLDGYIFSDFMGYCMALKEHGIGGDFYSCFPIERHFIYLKNDHKPSSDVIKFGKYGDDGSKSLYTYSRHAFMSRQYWWTQVGVHELLSKVEEWIKDKEQKARPGDTVNLFFESHGTSKGELQLGDRRLHCYVLRDWISGFKHGVQINAISGACYSGKFLDVIKSSNQKDRYFAAAASSDQKALSATRSVSNRIRNSRFSQAFVQSLAKVSLPGRARRQITWRLMDHEGYMRNQLMRNLTPTGKVVEPQFYATAPLDGMTLVEELIFRDKIDVLYDPRVSARRRRIEWPTVDPNVRSSLLQDSMSPSSSVSVRAIDLVSEELAKCDTRGDVKDDLGIFDELYTNNPDWRAMIRALYWRGRRQSATWDVFEILCSRGFINPRCLTLPVDILEPTPTTGILAFLLSCFSFIENDENLALDGKLPLQSTVWNRDIDWLATMVVRTGVQVDKLMETIEASGFFGKCNPETLEYFKAEHPEFVIHHNPTERIGVLRDDASGEPMNEVFGFWLPHGLDSENDETFVSQIRCCKQRFNLIEELFREVEQIPQEKLWLESEQADFFQRCPEKLPGAHNDFAELHMTLDDKP